MRWKLKKNGDFDIGSFYGALKGSSSTIFPCKSIWGMKAPHLVSFFVWTTTWGKILIGENLRGRGFTIVDWFCLCWCKGENVDNLLLHCEGVYRLWVLLLDCLRCLGYTQDGY